MSALGVLGGSGPIRCLSSVARLDGYIGALTCLALAVPVAVFGWGAVSAVLALLATVLLLRAQWQALLILAFPIYGLGGAIISNILIENGAYIAEEFRTGHQIGSTAGLALFTIAFLLVGHISIAGFTSRAFGAVNLGDDAVRRLRLLLLVGFGVALLAYATLIVLYGSAWELKGQRYEFWTTLPGLVALPMKVVHYYLVPAGIALLAFYFVQRPFARRDIWLVVMLALTLGAFFVVGERFSGYIQAATFAAIGIGLGGIARGLKGGAWWKILVGVAAVAIVLITTAAIGYAVFGVKDVVGQLVTRTVLQGHVWYGVLLRYQAGDLHVPIWELLRPNSIASPSGIDRLAFEISHHSFVLHRMERGISFTMGGPASALAGFGYIAGGIIFAASALAYGALAILTLTLLRRGWFLLSVLPLAAERVFNVVLMMGNWADIYHPVALLLYVGVIVLLVCAVVSRRRARSRFDRDASSLEDPASMS